MGKGGCVTVKFTTCVTEIEPLHIIEQECSAINAEALHEVNSMLCNLGVKDCISVASHGIYFKGEYECIDMAAYRNYPIVQEAIVLRLIISKICEVQPGILIRGMIQLYDDTADDQYRVMVERNVVYTAYTQIAWSPFEEVQLEEE